MGAVWGVLSVTAVVAMLGAGVIAYLGLQRHSRDQWRERMHETSQEVWQRSVADLPAAPEPRAATFDEIWGNLSEKGSAYVSLPPVIETKVEELVRERRGETVKPTVQLGEKTRPVTQVEPVDPPKPPAPAMQPPVVVPQEPIVAAVPKQDAIPAPVRMPAPAQMPPSFTPQKSRWVRVSPGEVSMERPTWERLGSQDDGDSRSIA